MKKKHLFIAATAIFAFASCAESGFIGDQEALESANGNGTISFNSGSKTATRATGADAAALLNYKFIVGGYKGNGTAMTEVFDNYIVNYVPNTAATTESNTANWEYVGVTAAAPSAVTGAQTIKYWDHAAAQYDFAAFSVGNKALVTTTPTSGQVKVTAIAPSASYTTGLNYSLTGAKADLAACYISNMTTAYQATPDYNKEVDLTFRSLAAKVRIALYETVPGYSVKNVQFYQDASTTTIDANISANTSGTLIGTFNTGGTYTVSFPTIGSGNKTNADYNVAHVALSDATTATKNNEFGALNYVARERLETEENIYLGRTSTAPSFAGTGTYYQTVLPNETGAMMELRVNYTLVPIDGADETIVVHGARAFIPAAYAQWKPNYAYTYLFKISDNSNGWTSTVSSDPAGLYPITFDAIVADTQDGMETITTVSTPSITSYQKGSDVTTDNEYATGNDIYVVVDNEGTVETLVVGALGVTDATSNAWLYEATVESGAVQGITEMSVDNAIANGVYDATNHKYTVTDANSKALVVKASAVSLSAITEIADTDSPTGVAITVNGAKFTPAADKTYVFQYQVTKPTFDSGTVLATDTSLKGYYTLDSTTYTRCDDTDVADGSTTYYKVTTPGVYQYKVIKVKP